MYRFGSLASWMTTAHGGDETLSLRRLLGLCSLDKADPPTMAGSIVRTPTMCTKAWTQRGLGPPSGLLSSAGRPNNHRNPYLFTSTARQHELDLLYKELA